MGGKGRQIVTGRERGAEVGATTVSRARGGPCVFLVREPRWLERLAEAGASLHKHPGSR